jgi:hypothetical protein
MPEVNWDRWNMAQFLAQDGFSSEMSTNCQIHLVWFSKWNEILIKDFKIASGF